VFPAQRIAVEAARLARDAAVLALYVETVAGGHSPGTAAVALGLSVQAMGIPASEAALSEADGLGGSASRPTKAVALWEDSHSTPS
jgi:hypothetical protein